MLLFVAILFCDVRFHVFVLYTMRPCLFIFFQSDCSQLCNRGNQFKKKPIIKFLCDEVLFSFFSNLTGPNQYTLILFLNLLT